MTDLFNAGSNYDYIMSLWKMIDSATDEQLVECIRSQCDPNKIRNGAIENGGNQVGVLGLIIEEIGRRKVRNAASVVVEYVAWPYYDDYWVHLVPRCFETLCALGDDTIVERLMQLTGANIVANKLIDFLGKLPPDSFVQDSMQQYDSDPSADPRGRLIMAALEDKLVDREAIKKWADKEISRINQNPPDWLCDLSLHGRIFLRNAPEDKMIHCTFEEKCLLLISFYKKGRQPLAQVVEKIGEGAASNYPVGIKALGVVLDCPAFQGHAHISRLKSQIEEQLNYIYEKITLVAEMAKEVIG